MDRLTDLLNESEMAYHVHQNGTFILKAYHVHQNSAFILKTVPTHSYRNAYDILIQQNNVGACLTVFFEVEAGLTAVLGATVNRADCPQCEGSPPRLVYHAYNVWLFAISIHNHTTFVIKFTSTKFFIDLAS